MDEVRIACAEVKRPGGKVIKACLKLQGSLVKGAVLTGDFFADPAEGFEEVLQELTKMETPVSKVVEKILELLRGKEVRFYGVTLEDVEEVLSLIAQRAIDSSRQDESADLLSKNVNKS
ncbi:MAG: hypothetical protein QXM76_04810 [Zestosphaera sp.]